jgi:ribosomal protein S19
MKKRNKINKNTKGRCNDTFTIFFKNPFKFHRADTLLKIIGDFNVGVEKNILTWSHASTIVPTLIGHVIINCNIQKTFIYLYNKSYGRQHIGKQ